MNWKRRGKKWIRTFACSDKEDHEKPQSGKAVCRVTQICTHYLSKQQREPQISALCFVIPSSGPRPPLAPILISVAVSRWLHYRACRYTSAAVIIAGAINCVCERAIRNFQILFLMFQVVDSTSLCLLC
jgi:hypothetical protein